MVQLSFFVWLVVIILALTRIMVILFREIFPHVYMDMSEVLKIDRNNSLYKKCFTLDSLLT